jgi:biopolymer transport protein ExbD
MAELNNTPQAPTKKVRSRKLNSRVDLTAMVDLAFLLITFFMLTTSLTKPRSMSVALPDKDGHGANVDENRTMTVLIDNDDKAFAFMGKLSDDPAEFTLKNTSELRREILARKKQVVEYSGNPDKGLIVLIKPTKKSKYKNLVDLLDEMAITDVGTYAITDLLPEEEKLIASR